MSWEKLDPVREALLKSLHRTDKPPAGFIWVQGYIVPERVVPPHLRPLPKKLGGT
jgi:hypothetical protein